MTEWLRCYNALTYNLMTYNKSNINISNTDKEKPFSLCTMVYLIKILKIQSALD